jgi:hypothetical protein
MKRFLAVAAICLVAVAIYAVTASGTPQAVTPKQFAALSKKVTTLQKKVTSLERELGAFENCFTAAVPVAEFGDETNQTEGYIYHEANATEFLTSALDITDAQHAQAYMLVTNAQCASIFNGGKRHAVSLGGAHK